MQKTFDIEKLGADKYILIKGARVHNLKNIDVAIERNKLIVITGLSGSGKSSLAFDTLYSEGQRRYVESLSSYARQFLGRMNKPEVDYIKGISPAIAIEQKVNTRNPRSTVGTSTEIYEYLKLLYARIGKTYSPISGNLVNRHNITDIVDFCKTLEEETKVSIYAPLDIDIGRRIEEQLKVLMQQGFSRVLLNDEIKKIDEILPTIKTLTIKKKPAILIDRVKNTNNEEEDVYTRIADSVQTAFYEGHGECFIDTDNAIEVNRHYFSNKFEIDGIVFEEPSVNLFTFNNPYGACKTCEGFGSIIGIDEDLVVPNKNLSIYEDAIVCWKGEKMSKWKDRLLKNAYKFDFPIHKPFYQLSDEQRKLLWKGNKYFHGLDSFFAMLEEGTYKIQYRVMLSRYRGKTTCPDCMGTRLRKDANYVKISGKSISELVLMPIEQLMEFFNNLVLDQYQMEVSKRLLTEIKNRIDYLCNVGLGYLTLNRLSSSLSGGESQRINLATSLGSSLVGSMYILDEPSIGLHQRDNQRLISVLKKLKELGNTVIVVEHDEEIIREADQIIDIGPLAGRHGGEVIFQGKTNDLISGEIGLTGKYLSGKLKIDTPEKRRKWKEFIEVQGCRQHNLKNINVKFPLNIFTVITGVSGSGKSTLIKNILYPALKKIYGDYGEISGKYDNLAGDIKTISDVEFVDQNPIGRSSRSNPVTYIKAYDDIRNLYADQTLAKSRNYKPGYFSFNVEGGRCPDCDGEGEVTIEMQFMADIKLVCDTCKGKRFKDEVLDVKFNDKTIWDILCLTVEEAIAFFNDAKDCSAICKRIAARLQPLLDVGLGYVTLGQSSSTLSGGEAQRIKLASFLTKGSSNGKILFIFDEPTTGLHFHDINKLLASFNALIERGHSVIIIEHNPEVIKCADWIIDLGPEGGEKGGEVIFEGTPEEIVKHQKSITGRFIKGKI
ncbi:MAG: excinuclease ABC subunit UvrA [Bacteroidetes bacterium]|nr:excinuclease ABC subunit UvrA [Bacteroidota bacterium]